MFREYLIKNWMSSQFAFGLSVHTLYCGIRESRQDTYLQPKIQQTKMLVRCQRFGDWFFLGLVWQYSSIQKNIIKVGAKSLMLTCSYHITLSLPFYTDPDLKRELNFCNGYLSLLYFWIYIFKWFDKLFDSPKFPK